MSLLTTSSSVVGTLTIGSYEVGPTLSRDDLSVTRLAVHTASGTLFSIKTFPMGVFDSEDAEDGSDWVFTKDYRQYLVIMMRMRHPHICPLMEVMHSPKALHLVTSFCSGGPLMNAVRMRWSKVVGPGAVGETTVTGTSEIPGWIFESRMSEEEARHYFQQLVFAVRYAHDKANIFHGELNLDNLCLDGPLPSDRAFATIDRNSYHARPKLSVLNFGLASTRAHSTRRHVFPTTLLVEAVEGGTNHSAALANLEETIHRVGFVSPELLIPAMEMGTTGKDSSQTTEVPITDDGMKKCDIWSCGVILYTMMAGAAPFAVRSRGGDENAMGNGGGLTFSSVGAVQRELGEFIRHIHSAEFAFPSYFSRGVRGVRHLIASMVVADPQKRISLDQVIAHPWFDVRVERSLLMNRELASTS
jgi:serine/threonine protein kinase